MKTSRTGIGLIKRFEGLRLTAYRCPAGVWTIGYGHTSAAGAPDVTPGMTITPQEADDILIRDLVKYEAAVSRALTRSPSQAEFDSMVSLCFNIGPGPFASSSLVRRYNAGDRARAADAFLMWDKAAGRVLPGLSARRAAERRLFLTSQQPPADWTPPPAAKPVKPVPVPPAPSQPEAPKIPPVPSVAPARRSSAGWLVALLGGIAAIVVAWKMKG